MVWFVVTVILSVAGLVLLWYSLSVESSLLPISVTILMGLITVPLARLLVEWNEEKETENLLAAARDVLSDELKRNFCTADLFRGSLLSTLGWDGVAKSGLALKFKESEFKPLLACYSAVGFYNHDVSNGNLGVAKQNRVKDFISEALSAIKSESPTPEQCCKEILPRWASPEKLSEACARRQKQ